MKKPTLGEFVVAQMHELAKDIREKVFEEAWFGRKVSQENSPTLGLQRSVMEHEDFKRAWNGPDHGIQREQAQNLEIDR